MLFTRECDYGVRVIRALSSGELVSVSKICEMEYLSSAIAYKVTRKLEKAGLVESHRGTNGGYCLKRPLSDISLYDVCTAIDPDILLMECMKAGHCCPKNTEDAPCIVHHEFCRLQSLLLQEMKAKFLSELFCK